MLALSDTFKSFLYQHQVIAPFIKLLFESTANDADRGLESFQLDVSAFVTKWGSIRRSLSYDTGKFSAGGHSFTLQNTKAVGDFLFTLRKRLGLNFWMDKTYFILWGFREIPTVADISSVLPKIPTLGFGDEPSDIIATPATLGWGDPATGEESLETATEETVKIYTGEIYNKDENRIGERVYVASKDILKQINDFKVCTKILSSDVIDYDSTVIYDNIGFQQVIKYGIHKMITIDGKELTNRKNPFSCTLGEPNYVQADIVGGGSSVDAYYLWYFPFQNEIDSSQYASNLNIYYWDYRKNERRWRAFNQADVPGKISIIPISGKGLFIKIINSSLTGITWSDYAAGTGATWDPDGDTPNENLDPAICIESKDILTDQNPVRIIYDLLNNSRFINIDAAKIDQYDFSAVDTGYTFDQTFQFFDNETALINTDFDKEISLLKTIEAIAKLCGMYFYSGADKSESEERRIRLVYNRTVSPCADKPPFLLRLSTAGKLKKLDYKTTSDSIKNKIIITNFDSSVSRAANFDIIEQGTGDRVLSLAATSNPKAYFYNSRNAAIAIAQRLLSQLENPAEIINTKLDASGMMIELADYVEFHDHKIDETVIGQIFNWTFAIATGITNLVARRYTDLYGPDATNIYKKWAYLECAYVDNDKTGSSNIVGGIGADASIALGGTTVTLGGGETIDANIAFLGMDVTLDWDGTPEHFRLKSITDATHFEIEESLEGGGDVASIAHANVKWSIGVSYHVY